MQVYAGLDVSLKTTHICLMDEAGKIVWRGVCGSDPVSIREALSRFLGYYGDSAFYYRPDGYANAFV